MCIFNKCLKLLICIFCNNINIEQHYWEINNKSCENCNISKRNIQLYYIINKKSELGGHILCHNCYIEKDYLKNIKNLKNKNIKYDFKIKCLFCSERNYPMYYILHIGKYGKQTICNNCFLNFFNSN